MNTAVTMTLGQLLGEEAGALADLEINGLSLDTRTLNTGQLFIALQGHDLDGRAFLAQAKAAGAVAALIDGDIPDAPPLPVLAIANLRDRLGEIAARYFANPSERIFVSAVTGTNGKTTVSHLFGQLIRSAGDQCGVIGTLGVSLDGVPANAVNTTPDALALQSTLAAWVDRGVAYVGMEASSHALDQGRMNGVDVDTAVFTNLTRDHLDYHGDMDAYGRAKSRLFKLPGLRAAILCADDPYHQSIAEVVDSTVQVFRVSSTSEAAEIRLSDINVSDQGLAFNYASPWGVAEVKSPLLGRFNVMNLALALTAVLHAGLPFEGAISAASKLRSVPGRMESIRREHAPLVVIDYAHTPDALLEVTRTLRDQCRGALTVVFGCGGDRDRGKRALMAEAVSGGADRAVLTSDNPRGEDPMRILADIEAAMTGNFTICEDRADAIALAIREAQPGDCVLIAGKGHEDYQQIGSERIPFSDRAIAEQVLTAVAA